MSAARPAAKANDAKASQFPPHTGPIFDFASDPTLQAARSIAAKPLREVFTDFIAEAKGSEELLFSRLRPFARAHIERIPEAELQGDNKTIVDQKNALLAKKSTTPLSGRERFLLLNLTHFTSKRDEKNAEQEQAELADIAKSYAGAEFFHYINQLHMDGKTTDLTEAHATLAPAVAARDTLSLVHLGRRTLGLDAADGYGSGNDGDALTDISREAKQTAAGFFQLATQQGSAAALLELGLLRLEGITVAAGARADTAPTTAAGAVAAAPLNAEEYFLLAASRGQFFGLVLAGQIAQTQNQRGRAAAFFRLAAEIPGRKTRHLEDVENPEDNPTTLLTQLNEQNPNFEAFYHFVMSSILAGHHADDLDLRSLIKDVLPEIIFHLDTFLQLFWLEDLITRKIFLMEIPAMQATTLMEAMEKDYDAKHTRITDAVVTATSDSLGTIRPLAQLVASYGIGLFAKPNAEYQSRLLREQAEMWRQRSARLMLDEPTHPQPF